MHAEKPVPLAHLSPVWPPPRAPHPWEIGRWRVWLGGLAIVALLHFGAPALFNWKHIISSSGGRYFIHPTIIKIPPLQQNDPRWADLLLGDTIDTIGQEGCAITSASMVLCAYGVDTDPQRLNTYLTTHGGYVGDGLLVWEKAAEVAPGGQVEKAYEDLPTYALIDAQILKGNPVIVRVHLRNGTTHFVVVVGKQGWDYLIRDPARPTDYGVYPLRKLVSSIEALRFFTIVPPQKPAPIATDNLVPGVAKAPAAPAPIAPPPVVAPAVSPTGAPAKPVAAP